MHGITMIFLFVIPMTTGAFGNYLLPLMIGARDMAFPRMNALSFWIFLALGALHVHGAGARAARPTPAGSTTCRWPRKQFSPGREHRLLRARADLQRHLERPRRRSTSSSRSSSCARPACRSTGCRCSASRSWRCRSRSLFALPPLTIARRCSSSSTASSASTSTTSRGGGDPLLWQHLFWIFGHPEVYIIILPAFGIATSIIPTFARRRMVAFPLVALAEILVAFIGFGVWAHHMFAVGLATVDDGLLRRGEPDHRDPERRSSCSRGSRRSSPARPTFKTPLLFIVGFIVFFIIGGLSGIMFAAIPFDQQVHDTLLHRRPLPLRDLRRGGVPDPRRPVLLVPEGHRPDVPRAARQAELLADVRRDVRRRSSRCTSSGCWGCRGGNYTYPAGSAGRCST